MAIAMAQNGGLGVIHKNMSPRRQGEEVDKVKRSESGMIADPVTIHPEQLVREALDVIARYKISGLPVVDGEGHLKGILTNRDLRFCTEFDRPIADFMTKDRLVTAPVGTTFEEAKALLHRHRIEKLLVVDEAGNLKGLITVKDIKKAQEFPNACKDKLGRLRVAAAVGVSADLEERCAALVERHVDMLSLDSSHAHSRGVMDAARRIKQLVPNVPLIVGNVATAEAAVELIDLGTDCVKVGIGPGSICTTRVVTGGGMPQITAILECSKVAHARGVPIIADGGVRYSGDITKALAAGADVVMIGSLFAGVEESPDEHSSTRAAPQGLPRHGLARRREGGARLGRPLLPGGRGAGQAGARGDRGHGRLQGPALQPADPARRRPARRHGPRRLRLHRRAARQGPLHPRHRLRPARVPRSRRGDHQGSAKL